MTEYYLVWGTKPMVADVDWRYDKSLWREMIAYRWGLHFIHDGHGISRDLKQFVFVNNGRVLWDHDQPCIEADQAQVWLALNEHRLKGKYVVQERELSGACCRISFKRWEDTRLFMVECVPILSIRERNRTAQNNPGTHITMRKYYNVEFPEHYAHT